MKILFDNTGMNLPNVGDAAQCQVAVRRLQHYWPDAVVHVITTAPDLLQQFCPGAVAVPAKGRSALFRPVGLVPYRISKVLPRAKRIEPFVSRQWPGFAARCLGLYPTMDLSPRAEAFRFLSALGGADLYVVGGGGDFYDDLSAWTTELLTTLRAALKRRIPTGILGQGIGNLQEPTLRRLAARVLPQVSLIFLRETMTGPGSVQSLGVASDRIRVTGDDAIELAYERRPAALGNRIGVNVRVATYSQVTREDCEVVAAVVHACASKYDTSLIPIPIAFNVTGPDLDAISSLLKVDGNRRAKDLMSPAAVIDEVAQCRVVVTGSYHAAVFALSQGIPAVGLARSPYYRDKFGGLASHFGDGCQVVSIEGEAFAGRLREAIDRAWTGAPQLRQSLLDAAVAQIKAGHNAYRELYELVTYASNGHRTGKP